MTDSSQPTFDADPRGSMRKISGLDFLNGLMDGSLPPPPFAATTRIIPLEAEEGRVVFEGTPSCDFCNPMGVVHGGWVATLLDTGMACAVHSALKAGEAFTTLSLNITYARPVTEATGPLRCEAAVLHTGGRIAGAEGRIYDKSGNLIAHGSEICVVIRTGRGP